MKRISSSRMDGLLPSCGLDERKFEDLWELVKSSIYMVRKHKDKYKADFTDMTVFKSELSSYMDQLGLENDEEELIDTYEEY